MTAGKPFDYALATRYKIVKGTSNKAEIEHLLGDPYARQKTASGETWTYYFREESSGDPTYLDRTLRVDFDAAGTVVNYSYKAERKCLHQTSGRACT